MEKKNNQKTKNIAAAGVVAAALFATMDFNEIKSVNDLDNAEAMISKYRQETINDYKLNQPTKTQEALEIESCIKDKIENYGKVSNTFKNKKSCGLKPKPRSMR